MAPLLQVKNLYKSYGSKQVLKDVSFSFEAGKIVGLLGPNGCGKTSLLKIIVGLINDYKGEVLIDGQRPGPYTKSIIAYMSETKYLQDWMTAIDAINYFNDFYKDFDKEKARAMLTKYGLQEKQKIKSMSKGMQEKLQLTLVMCRKAKLYVLDEPLGGVDPATRGAILNTIMSNKTDNSMVIISTHLIHDLESIFDNVLMIGDGNVLLNTTVEELRSQGKTAEDAFKEVFADVWQTD